MTDPNAHLNSLFAQGLLGGGQNPNATMGGAIGVIGCIFGINLNDIDSLKGPQGFLHDTQGLFSEKRWSGKGKEIGGQISEATGIGVIAPPGAEGSSGDGMQGGGNGGGNGSSESGGDAGGATSSGNMTSSNSGGDQRGLAFEVQDVSHHAAQNMTFTPADSPRGFTASTGGMGSAGIE